MKTTNLLVAGTVLWAFFLAIWNQSLADLESCKSDFWPHAIEASIPWKCICKAGYIWNYNGTECIEENEQNLKNLCQKKYGNRAIYSSKNDECECEVWATFNDNKTQCVELTQELALNICKREFWNYATTGNSLDTCNCLTGYAFNETRTQCIADTPSYATIRCQRRYWEFATVGKTLDVCDCKPGYVRNQYQTECINSSLIQKNTTVSEEIDKAIKWMYENKLTIYNTLDTFMGNSTLTREQAAKFFVEAVKSAWKRDLEKVVPSKLSDVHKADPTLQSYITEAVQLGLFQGTKWKFNPLKPITKAQALAVLMRAWDGMKQENVNPWYLNYYLLADKNHLLENLGFSLYSLDKENITRKEIALLLYRLEREEGNSICYRDFGEHALWEGSKDEKWSYICGCKYGYKMAKETNQCISEEVVKMGTDRCKSLFWEVSYSDGTKDETGEYYCRCEEGYNRDDEKNPTRCI